MSLRPLVSLGLAVYGWGLFNTETESELKLPNAFYLDTPSRRMRFGKPFGVVKICVVSGALVNALVMKYCRLKVVTETRSMMVLLKA